MRTRRLLLGAALSALDKKRTTIQEGELPDASNIPTGCRFHPRCPSAFDRCPSDDPVELLPTGEESHGAACWLLAPA
jgi:oligopeptide/dipeptide ABC transporter ATP-binding protein